LRVEKGSESIATLQNIHLYMSLIKKDLFELVVEKVTELGVKSITPILTDRTQGKNLNMERLNKIAIEASEQCGRGNIPIIKPVTDLENALSSIEGEIIVCDKSGSVLSDQPINLSTINLLIGPEGGWTDEERKLFSSKGAKFISLGDTILRAETAGIVGVYSLIK
jgi:16S rRNA (uracil1498-N3)-methyltransferase